MRGDGRNGVRRRGVEALLGCLVLALLAAVAVRAVAQTSTTGAGGAASKDTLGLVSLEWLTGDWSTTSGGRVTEEHWLPPAGQLMPAVGRTISGGRTVFFEFLRIEHRPTGVFYVAQPLGKPPTDFRMVSQGDRTVVFENLAHDFPKRVTYWSPRNDSLYAQVAGDSTSREPAELYRYRRMPHRH
jgi:hypothetical protein